LVSALLLAGCAALVYDAKTDRLLAEEAALPHDPSTGIIDGDSPYYMVGDSAMPAVLLLHGFGGIPDDLRPLAEELNRRGYTVYGPLLAGHGTSAADMAMTGWRDWLKSAEDAYFSLSRDHKDVYVVGFSMGGLLALNLSIKHDFDGLVLLAPCVFLPGEDDMISTEYMIRNVSPYIPADYVISEPRTMDPHALDGRHAYTLFPLSSLRSLVELMELTRPHIPEVNERLLVIQSVNDGTVGKEGPDYIIAHSSAPEKKVEWVENSTHHLVRDLEKDRVISEVIDFIGDGS